MPENARRGPGPKGAKGSKGETGQAGFPGFDGDDSSMPLSALNRLFKGSPGNLLWLLYFKKLTLKIIATFFNF